MPLKKAQLFTRVTLGGLCFLAHLPQAHAADKKQQCAAAYEQSQELRASSKLHAARDALVICAQDACPAFVQSDCTQWLAEIQREMPTVVLAAVDSKGSDLTGVKTSMDGVPVETEQEGKSIGVDPGRHVFRFELEGFAPIERAIVVRQGEKDRIVSVTFDSSQPSPPVSVDTTPSPTPVSPLPVEDVTSSKPGPLRPYAFVAAGVGAAGLIGFTVLGLVGKSQRSDIEDSGCKPNCNKDDVEAVRTKLVLADVSLGVGVAGIGTAVALWFLSEPKSGKTGQASAHRVFVDVKPTPGGGYAAVYGRF